MSPVQTEFLPSALAKRPILLQDLVGQSFVQTILSKSLDKKTLGHAYLFSGPRGTGKTSTARIFARSLICQKGPTSAPCGECLNCREALTGVSLDIIEMDGASHTSVNDAKTIKEELLFAPHHARYKIYIIDEIHMLSNSAFNALLKTIEEPPEYVIFLFLTTEIHKIPLTIRSRCQHFHFRTLGVDIIVKALQDLCKEKEVEYQDQALVWLARQAGGSLRDAYMLFDQIYPLVEKELTLILLTEYWGVLDFKDLHSLCLAIATDSANLLKTLQNILARGVPLEQLLLDLIEFFHNILLVLLKTEKAHLLRYPTHYFKDDLLKLWSKDQLEKIIDLCLESHKNLKESLQPQIELQSLLLKIHHLKNHVPYSTLFQEIQAVRKILTDLGVQTMVSTEGSLFNQGLLSSNSLSNSSVEQIKEQPQEASTNFFVASNQEKLETFKVKETPSEKEHPSNEDLPLSLPTYHNIEIDAQQLKKQIEDLARAKNSFLEQAINKLEQVLIESQLITLISANPLAYHILLFKKDWLTVQIHQATKSLVQIDLKLDPRVGQQSPDLLIKDVFNAILKPEL